jgi:hypothetical protein
VGSAKKKKKNGEAHPRAEKQKQVVEEAVE